MIHDHLDECTCAVIQKASKSDKILDDFINITAARMVDGYVKVALKAIEDVVKIAESGSGKIRDKDVKRMQKTVDKTMSAPYTLKELDKFDKDIQRYYVLERGLVQKEFKIKLTNKAKPELGDAFDLRDHKIVEGIQAQNKIAAANLYKNGYAAHVADAIAQTVVEAGLSRQIAGKLLEENLIRALGLSPDKVALKVVPPDFNGTAKSYYKGLSTTTYNRAQNFNRINLFDRGGFTEYEIVAIMDNRTSEICRAMHGRTFKIGQAQSTIDRILEAEDAEELKQIAPWRKDLTEFGVKTQDAFKTGPRATSFSSSLADAGMALPPYHFRCRTSIRPV